MKVIWRSGIRDCMHSLIEFQEQERRLDDGRWRTRLVRVPQPCVMKRHRQTTDGKPIHQTASKKEWT